MTETSLGIGSTNFSFDARGFRYLEDNDSLSYDSRSHVFDQRGNRYSTVGYYRIGATWHSYSVVDTFDSLNRRVSKTVFVNGVTSVYFYYYDALGRVSEVQFTPNTSSSATYQVFQFHWLDDKLVAYSQTDYPSATVSKRYVVTDDTNRPIEMWNWPSSGNTTRVWAINPSEYGLDTNVLGSSYYQPVLFPGQMIDAETTAYRDDGTTVHRPALVLNGNRTYDAFTGSHLQVSLSPSEIETNYTYARTNPPATSGRPEMGSSELVIGPDGNFFDCDSTTSTSVHIKGVGEVISINTTCRQLTHWNSGGDGGGGSFCGRFWYSPPCPTGGGNGNPPPEPEDDDPGQWHPYRDNTGFKNYQCLNAPCQFSCRNGGVYTTLVTTKYHWTSNGAISEAKKLCKDQATFVCGPSGGFGWLDSDKQFCDDRAEMRDFEMTE